MVEVHSGDKKKELGKRDKGGKMVTDRPTTTTEGPSKSFFCGGRTVSSPLYSPARRCGRRPLPHTPISVIIALAKAGHCPLYYLPGPRLCKLQLKV